MPVNLGMARLSDHLLLLTVVIYSLAMLAFAGELAYGRRRTGAAASQQEPELALAGSAAVGGPAALRGGQPASAGSGGQAPPPAQGAGGGQSRGGAADAAADQAVPAGLWVRAALALTAVGLATHVVGIVTRGLAAHRIPWGNMYEFVTAITCGAVLVFLVLVLRYRAYFLGLFVMVPVVLGLGLCATVLYTAAGPLMPALHSYWIAIHVTAAIISTGIFMVAATTTVMYLFAERSAARVAAGVAAGGIMRRLPEAQVLDRLAYRTVVFGFPIWTFAIIAGAIWADQAWGRYWGWDPKETWAFITWVAYACFLHARATAGWRGRKAAVVQLVAFGCLIFNLIGVNLWVTGLHSYAGIS
ncbi:MAG TPA: c-type cytochrome biogenesis protein CcsB [Streptosporangiaceae bacterium]|nr:c-type cytochrome biogenesis protein CcsB [Streptosporangiaceae bacterium]